MEPEPTDSSIATELQRLVEALASLDLAAVEASAAALRELQPRRPTPPAAALSAAHTLACVTTWPGLWPEQHREGLRAARDVALSALSAHVDDVVAWARAQPPSLENAP